MSTLFAKNLSKFKIIFLSFHNSHNSNKVTSFFTTVSAIFFDLSMKFKMIGESLFG